MSEEVNIQKCLHMRPCHVTVRARSGLNIAVTVTVTKCVGRRFVGQDGYPKPGFLIG